MQRKHGSSKILKVDSEDISEKSNQVAVFLSTRSNQMGKEAEIAHCRLREIFRRFDVCSKWKLRVHENDRFSQRHRNPLSNVILSVMGK